MTPEEGVVELLDRITQLSYFEILGLPLRYATPPEVREAFHAFARKYHPDLFTGCPDHEREAAREVFKRAVEAYEVLRAAALQKRYVEGFLKKGHKRLPAAEFGRSRAPEAAEPSAPPRAPAPPGPRTWVDEMTSDDSREIAERIDRMMAAGNMKGALDQVALLEDLEPGNLAVKQRRNAIRRRLPP